MGKRIMNSEDCYNAIEARFGAPKSAHLDENGDEVDAWGWRDIGVILHTGADGSFSITVTRGEKNVGYWTHASSSKELVNMMLCHMRG